MQLAFCSEITEDPRERSLDRKVRAANSRGKSDNPANMFVLIEIKS